jgi:uncharacterized transporter YbjL
MRHLENPLTPLKGGEHKRNIKIIGQNFKINRVIQSDGQKVAKKHIVRVVLSPQQKELLDRICQKLGQSESETMRVAFLEYAKSISLVTEKVHG